MAIARLGAGLERERRFFFGMAVLVFVTAVAGFGSQVVLGRTWFTEFPWQVHVHAAVFSSWISLYLIQSWLVVDGRNLALHRRLGWVGAALATLMVPLGISGTLAAIARGSITGIFPLGLFLALDTLHILGFGALTVAAVALRAHAGWHKRLMLCGTVLVIAPALSRLFGLLPLGGSIPIAVIVCLLLYILAGMIFDRVTHARVHPAYWWGLATVVLVEGLIVPVGTNASVVRFAEGLAS